jgi:hypothetical protein
MQDEFRVAFSMVDAISAPIVAMAARVEGANRLIEGSARRMSDAFAPLHDLQAGFRLLHSEVGRLGGNLGIPRVSEAFGTLWSRTRGLGQHMAGLFAPLAGLAAFSTVGGLMSIMHGAVETASGLNDMYSALGAESDAHRGILADLRYSAVQTGATAEDVTQGVGKLQKALGEMRAGRNDDLAGFFRHYRISLRDANGEMRTAIDLIPEIMDKIAKARNPERARRIALAAFGRGGGALIAAAKEFEENAQRRRRFGSVFSREDIEQLDNFGDRWKDLEISISAVRNVLGAQLAPVLLPVVQEMTQWVLANRNLIKSEVVSFVQQVRDAIRDTDWSLMWRGINSTVTAISSAVEFVGGWKVALSGLAVVMGGPFIAAVAGVGTAIAGLGVALLTAPIGPWVLAATAGIALVAQNWDTIAKGFKSVADGIAGAIREALEWWDRLTARVGNRPNEPATPRANRNSANGARRIEGFDETDSARDNTLARAGSLGQATIRVEFVNAPPGARIAADTTGPGLTPPSMSVGYAMGGP